MNSWILRKWFCFTLKILFVRKIEKTREKQEKVFFSQSTILLSVDWSTANGHVTPSIPTNFTIGCFPTQHPILWREREGERKRELSSLFLFLEFLFSRGDQRGKLIVRFCQPRVFLQRIRKRIQWDGKSWTSWGFFFPLLYIFKYSPPFRTGLRDTYLSIETWDVTRLLRDQFFFLLTHYAFMGNANKESDISDDFM